MGFASQNSEGLSRKRARDHIISHAEREAAAIQQDVNILSPSISRVEISPTSSEGAEGAGSDLRLAGIDEVR